jgi:hypothetical protein
MAIDFSQLIGQGFAPKKFIPFERNFDNNILKYCIV